MKKILFFYVLLLATKVLAQTTPANEMNLDQMLVNIDRSTVTSSIIYNRVAPFANLYSFNTNSTRNTADFKLFKQALLEMYLSSNKTLFSSVENLKSNLNPILYNDNSVNMGILNSPFQMLNYNEINPSLGRLQYNETTFLYYDSGNTAQPLFNTFQTTVIAPLKDVVIGNTISFNWNTLFDFENQLIPSKKIKTLTVDYGTGIVYNIISNGVLTNTTQQITYPNSGDKQITFAVTYIDDSKLTTYAKINYQKVNSITGKLASNPNCGSDYGLTKTEQLISDYAFQGYEESFAFKGFIEYRTFYRTINNGKIVKPIIFIDGFDPGDVRKVLPCEYADGKYDGQSLSDLMKYGVNKDKNLIKELQSKGYDVIIVNQPTYAVMNATPYQKVNLGTPGSREVDGGGDYIERNGLNLVTLIKKINGELKANGSIEKLAIVGPSMGGQISRYALAWMEKMNIDHNTRLWVSVDSPNLGANIPLGTQAEINLLKDGNDDAKDFYYKSLGSPSAKQQLIELHGESGSYHIVNQSLLNGRTTSQGYSTNSGSPFYQRFYNNQFNNGLPNSKGYPMNLRKIAMTNGSLTGVKSGFDSQQTMNIRGFMDICVLFLCAKVHAASMEIFTLPSTGNTSRIARFKQGKDFDKTTIAPNINSRGNMDVVPGGYFNSYEKIHNSIIAKSGGTTYFAIPFYIDVSAKDINLESRVNTKIHAFIPTFSALGIKNPEQDWSSPLNRNLVCTGETPFDSFYGEDQNTEHTSFNDNSIAFLFKELGDNVTLPSQQPPSFPIQLDLLTGTNTICLNTTTTYQLDACKVPSSATWAVSPNLQIVSTTGYNVTVKSLTNGAGTITATFQDGKTISKNVWVGVPAWATLINSSGYPYDQFNLPDGCGNYDKPFWTFKTDPIANINDFVFESSNGYSIIKNHINGTASISAQELGMVGGQSVVVKAYARNNCGAPSKKINFTLYKPTSCQCGFGSNCSLARVAKPNFYIVFPNPAKEVINISLFNQSTTPSPQAQITAKLYNTNGLEKRSVSVTNNTATVNVSTLPKGIYVLKINIDGVTESHQVVVE
jgi:hypothetical protein